MCGVGTTCDVVYVTRWVSGEDATRACVTVACTCQNPTFYFSCIALSRCLANTAAAAARVAHSDVFVCVTMFVFIHAAAVK